MILIALANKGVNIGEELFTRQLIISDGKVLAFKDANEAMKVCECGENDENIYYLGYPVDFLDTELLNEQ